MPQVVIVSSLGPQGPVGPQGLQGLTGSMAESNSGSFAITGSLTVSGSSTFTNIGPAVFSGSSNFTSLTASSALISGNVTVLGTASINTLIVNQTQLSTGSNQLGDAANDTQTLYGTVVIPTGSLTVSGSTLTSGSLTVDGNIGLTGDIIQQDVNLDMKISGAQTGRAVRLVTSSTGLRLQALGSTTSNFTLSTTVSSSETARVTILEGGNVGIGTTSPSYTLDISGSLRVGTPTATPHLVFARASNNYITTPVGGALLFNLNNGAVENASIVGIYSTGLKIGTGFSSPSAIIHVRGTGATSATTALLVQNSNASASLTVLDNGYVGIGTSTPVTELHVNGSGNTGYLHLTNSTSGGTINDGMTVGVNASNYFVLVREAAPLYFGTDSTERMRITSTGNVGIGTTAPSVKLEIKATGSNETTQRWLDDAGNLLGDFAELGDAGVFRVGYAISAVSTARPLITLNGGTGNSSATIELRSKSSVTNIKIASDLPSYISGSNLALGFTSPTASAILHISGAAADNVFRVDTPSIPYALFVSGSGNVGIGTNNPVKALTLNANNLDDGFVIRSATNNTLFQVTKDGASNNTAEMFLYSGGSIRLAIRSTLNFSYFNGGNFGFGNSTDPGARLSIRGAGATSGTTALLVQNSNTSASLSVLDNGYVGIGSTTPLRQLYVAGDLEVTNGIYGDSTDHTFYTIASGSYHHRFYTRTSGGTSLERFTIQGGADTGSAYFQNTNVGIGTTTPESISNTTTLTVNGANGGGAVSFQVGGVRTGLVNGNDNYLTLQSYASRALSLGYNGSNTLVVNTSNNVGIGTTAPSAKLDVIGTGVFGSMTASRGNYSNGLSLQNNAGQATSLFLWQAGIGSGHFGFPSGSSNLYIVNSYNTGLITEPNYIVLSNTGNVGIGTTAPTARLHVVGTGSTSATAAFLVRNSNLSASMVVKDDGFVGIGTVSPTGKVHITPYPSYYTLVVGRSNGYSSIKASTDDALSTTLALDSAGGATILNHYVSDNVWLVTGGGSVGVGTNAPTARLHAKGTGTTSATTAFRVENANASGSMIILDNGYVGIGTAAPSYSLDVYGSYHQYQVQGLLARYDISSANANQNRGVWDFYTNVATAADFFGRFGFKFEGGVSDSFKQYQLHIGDSVNPKFVVDGAGRVAIGTITPSASLHISGSSGSVLLEVDSNSSQNILYVSGSGNVGIGTNAPTQKLDVDGAILVRAGNAVYFRDTTSYIYEGSGLNIVSGATRNIRLNAGGIDRLTVSASGNIGIGTTTPAATLDIQSTSTGSIRISGSAGSQITFVRPTAGLTGFVRYTSTQMDIGTVGSDGLNLFTSNTSRVSIQTNGDVLIGAGSVPAGRLEVKGSGTTSSTISLRVGNSTPAPSLVITDDLTSRFYGNVGIGALPTSGSLHISGAASTSSAAVYIYKSGSTTLDIQGSQGQLFSVTDALSGSLMSVNDISGLPILEVFSDDRVVMGSFSQPALLVTGSAVRFPATASTAPAYTGSEGQVVFGVVGGNAFIYAWLGGRWRSGSLA